MKTQTQKNDEKFMKDSSHQDHAQVLVKRDVEELKSILYNPIKFILKDDSFGFGKMVSDKKRKRLMINKTLAQLEWLDFRDGMFRTGLRKRYYVDEYRVKHTRFISHGDIKDFNLFLRLAVLTIFNRVRKANDVSIGFDFTGVPINPIQPVGVEQK